MLFLNPHVQDKIGSGKDGGNQVAVFFMIIDRAMTAQTQLIQTLISLLTFFIIML